jgi:hypothetical protein
MEKRQKKIILKFLSVIAFTAAAVVSMAVLKDVVNKTESLRAMKHLSDEIFNYKKENGVTPPQAYINMIKDRLPGYVRLGSLKYRARWIEIGSGPDEILAYSEKKYPLSFLGDGFIVLKLSGKVEWMDPHTFRETLKAQQSQLEIQTTQKEL